jgi:hypothetical protein
MPLAAITPLLPLMTTGVLFVQDGVLRINQNQLLEMPEDEQQATLRRLYLQLVRNDGSREVTSQMPRWALKTTQPADEPAKRKFLISLEEELRRIFRADAAPAETTSPPSAPATAPARIYPEMWDSLPRPLRIQFMRLAIEHRLEKGEQPHAAFLIARLADWLAAPDERNLGSAAVLLDSLGREPPGSALHNFFWESIFESPGLNDTLLSWLQEESGAGFAGAGPRMDRRKILQRWVMGQIVFINEPLMREPSDLAPADRISSADVLHPKWQQRFTRRTRSFLAQMAGSSLPPEAFTEDPGRHGRFLAQALVSTARYPLSLTPEDIGRSVAKLMEKELPVLREILNFLAVEALSEEPDWPFLRGFWLKLSSGLKGGQPKEVLQRLVMHIMVDLHRKSDVRKKRP